MKSYFSMLAVLLALLLADSTVLAKDKDKDKASGKVSLKVDQAKQEAGEKSEEAKATAAAAKKKVVESEDEDFLDDDVSSDEDDEPELDINNTQALIKDEEDRKYLDSLPELEREAILGERFENLRPFGLLDRTCKLDFLLPEASRER